MVLLTELDPSSSSSSSHDDNRLYDYDVFLSFRGVDTRNNFTDHLYNALLDAGINTFLDDDDIETGEPLKPVLVSAIQSSRASIIILSKNYASSTWCLDELVLIIDEKKKFNQIVIPIFYHVEPTDVRKQQNSFREAMAEHKQKMESVEDAQKRSQLFQKIESWKIALTKVADLKGKDSKGRKETEFIKEIVFDIHRRLRVPLSSSSTLPRLIGVGYEIELISSWLTDGSCHTADILTVVGMSGIGKTSLTRHVFRLHSSKFDKSSFIEDINRKANEHFNGLLDLQKQLHGDISKKMELRVNDVTGYTSMIENVLARKRVLIVLDDVGSLKQLDAILGNKGLHPGSKVMITTKDASLIEKGALFNPQVQPKHKKVSLNVLHERESLKLFCLHSFKSQIPKEGYVDVAKELVKYCDGHPLAIEVLGSSLQDRDVEYWRSCIKNLKKGPNSDINTKLRMSFDALPHNDYKELFKHIACFFVGMDRDVTETILDACDFEAKYGITNLIDRCLLNIGWNKKLEMHSLIQEMGRDLIRQESPNKPWKRSRLWCHEESFKVLKQKNGKGHLLGLSLDTRMLDKTKLCKLKTESFSKMDNLMLLQLNYVQLEGCFKNFPEELRWLCICGSPLESIPLDLPMENLVVLDMSYSNIEYFDLSYSSLQPPVKKQKLVGSSSKDKRLLGSLKILDLSFCKHLHGVGGFFELPKLERLILRNCTGLIELCESAGQYCDKLAHIDLSYCYQLRNPPKFIGKLQKVKTVLLDGCYSSESQIQMDIIPRRLKFSMIPLQSSLGILSLANNNLSNECFPMDLSCLSKLQELCLDHNPIVSMPNCVRTLPSLEILWMAFCDKLISVDHPPRTLRKLSFFRTKIRKIKFDLEMTPLKLNGMDISYLPLEFDGMVKVQGMENVEEKILHSLGWTKSDIIKERPLRFHNFNGDLVNQMMYYQFGIFSTFYLGDEIPNWISSCRSKGSSISFIIPSSPSNLRGLNFCYVHSSHSNYTYLPMIKISNITQNHNWIYSHYFGDRLLLDENKQCLIYLSHWMFGPNEMKVGDHITITVAEIFPWLRQYKKECGIGFVYEDEDGKNEEEEDALGYFKSWNHIIGGDLSRFQLTTGEYILDNREFIWNSSETDLFYLPFINPGIKFKEEERTFGAFSKKKPK